MPKSRTKQTEGAYTEAAAAVVPAVAGPKEVGPDRMEASPSDSSYEVPRIRRRPRLLQLRPHAMAGSSPWKRIRGV